MFLAEILEQHELPRQPQVLDASVVAEFSVLQIGGCIAPEVAPLDDSLTERLVNGFVMNVSALNSYLRCPLDFYFTQVVRIPSPKNEAAEFGSAVHHALEQLFKKMQDNDRQFPSVDTFINDFTWYMQRHRECFTREQFARRMEYGTEILRNYYMKHLISFNKVVSIERYVKNVVVDDMLLKGKIDKIEFNGKEATIVDYKTGDPEKCKEKLARPNPKIPNGGDYWRQAVFYKIMLDHLPGKDWSVQSVEFDFVEPNKKKEYIKEVVKINEMDITDVKGQIATVYKQIQNKNFYTGCGKEECHWCGFVKTNKLAIALHELKAEEPENSRSLLRVAP
jgi:DNA helicase-2/ATP-dependent DNA helicase PcrA